MTKGKVLRQKLLLPEQKAAGELERYWQVEEVRRRYVGISSIAVYSMWVEVYNVARGSMAVYAMFVC